MNKKLAVLTALGNIFIGLGISILNLSSFGVDPFTSMTIGTSNLLGIGLGVFQMTFNILLYIPVLYFNRKAVGIGALINLFLMGYIIEFFMAAYAMFGITPATFMASLPLRLILVVIGIPVICFGVALYMDCNLGVSPYDGVGPVVEKLTNGKVPFKYARIIQDIMFATIGFVTGILGNIITVGFATIIVAFGTGPIVDWFQRNITHKMTGQSM